MPTPDGAAPQTDGEGSTGTRYCFLLFVSGASTSSARAIRNVQALCEEHLNGCYELTVIDVRQESELAEQRRVLATPTLIRQSPLPELMRVGDFSNHGAVLAALGIQAVTHG